MKTRHIIILSASCMAATAVSCSSASDTDTEKPVIVDAADASPQGCQSFRRSSSIAFRYTFTDNEELGAFNIEIHNNFDHHSHSTESADTDECADGDGHHESQPPVNPWVFNASRDIPAGQTSYAAAMDIPVPADIDTGDYHFAVRLTDKAGWQQFRSFAIRITGQ